MANRVSITCDVNTDVDSRRGAGMLAGTPPEAEGATMGIMDANVGSAAEGGGIVVIPGSIEDLVDVEVNASTLANGDVLVWDGTHWVNQQQTGGGGDNGFEIPLGPVETLGDGSWLPGAVVLADDMPISEGLDRLNEVVGKLVPPAPPEFPNGTLTISNTAGNSPRLATGVTDNTGDNFYAPGAAVARITAAGVSSLAFNDVGPGDSGTLSVWVNEFQVGSRALTGTGDAGNYAGLVISDQQGYPPANPTFYKTVDVALNLVAASIGANKVQIDHSDAGTTAEVYFVRDATTATPALSATSVVQAAAGTLAYSSGVPHYGTGATLTVAASYSNLAGETYYGGADPFTVSGENGTITAQAYNYPALGITTPIARQTLAATAITPVTVSVNGAVHASGRVQGVAKNVNGSGTAFLASTLVLVKNGVAPANKVDEMSIPVTGMGSTPNGNNAVSVTLPGGDTPAGTPTPWDPTALLTTDTASVVAGVLKHDQIDYTNYLPSGPDYSVGRSAPQYRTVSFKRAFRSTYKIVVTGSYAGCWVKLPGVSDVTPNAPNGWWNAFAAYDGAGVPGEVGDPVAGCALGTVMNGGSGTFTITFGTESSTNSTGNEILIRFRLNAGQSISALAFSN